VSFGVAAGNSNSDACADSPARVPQAITVGASTITDARASFSSFGTCVDIFAPGLSITSSWNLSDIATNTISGTSMATPHVVGVAALIAAANPTFTPQQVRDSMVATSTPNKVTNPGAGSPNRLLFVVNGATTPPPPPPPGGGTCTGSNGTDVAVPDFGAAVNSPITISGCNRSASATSRVEVHVRHTYRGDLRIDLVAPDGSSYRLKTETGADSAPNVDTTFTANVSSEAGNGTWNLRVQDLFRVDTGTIDTWTLTL
jgi:subtilisin family serine protease